MFASLDHGPVRDELKKAVKLLSNQGYASEYAVAIGLSISGRSAFIKAALAQAGWEGEAMTHATDCGDEGSIYSVFDPDELTFDLVDALVRDEAEFERSRRDRAEV